MMPQSFICWESFDRRFVVKGGSVVGAGFNSDGPDAGEVSIDSVGLVVAVWMNIRLFQFIRQR